MPRRCEQLVNRMGGAIGLERRTSNQTTVLWFGVPASVAYCSGTSGGEGAKDGARRQIRRESGTSSYQPWRVLPLRCSCFESLLFVAAAAAAAAAAASAIDVLSLSLRITRARTYTLS